MGYALDLLKDGGDYRWFAENAEKTLQAPQDWQSIKQDIRENLQQLNVNREEGAPDEFSDDKACDIAFYENGTASINIAGWGNWHTRAPRVKAYVEVFEKYGFRVYDNQAQEKWLPGKSTADISALIGRFQIPEITKTGKGCKLKPLTDAEWTRMM